MSNSDISAASRSYRILLVDDNDADIYLFRRALKKSGVDCELTVIEDGAEAFTFARQQGKYASHPVPDLAVLDLNLPKHGGSEILKRLRQNEHFKEMPVVIMTSSISLNERAELDGLGVLLFLIKPQGLEEFLQIGESLKSLLAK